MTDIEQEARDLLNASVEDRGRDSPYYFRSDNRRNRPEIDSVCRALEQRDAERQAHAEFRQRVSDEMAGVMGALRNLISLSRPHFSDEAQMKALADAEQAILIASMFIIPKPVDPLVEACQAAGEKLGLAGWPEFAAELRAACIKRGIPIPDKREEG